MATQALSDKEFISTWNKHLSGTAVANELGISVRGVMSRRNRIEKRTGVVLGAVPHNGQAKHDIDSVKLIISSRRDANRFEIQNGSIIVGSDAHYSPGHTPVAHKALCNLLVDMGSDVKAVILNGDILDGGQVSRHARVRWQKSFTVKQELEVVLERTTEIEKAAAPGVHLLRTYGNHDARFETRLSAQVPEFEGVQGFTLRDHLPMWEDSDRIDINSDCVVIHDWHQGVHSGYNDALKGGCHVVTGHTHELSCKAVKGFKEARYGIKTGMLADDFQSEFDYRVGKPGLNWQSGFAVLTWVDGILLYPEFAAVRENGKCYFRGKLYAD